METRSKCCTSWTNHGGKNMPKTFQIADIIDFNDNILCYHTFLLIQKVVLVRKKPQRNSHQGRALRKNESLCCMV